MLWRICIFPNTPERVIDLLLTDILPADIQKKLARTPQHEAWHGEGDVLTHTKMVCDALTRLEGWQQADEQTKTSLYLAAAFHDLGKIPTTRQEDGIWVAPSHGRVSANMTRQLLWERLSGTPERQQLRETVCSLVRYHGLPLHAIDDPDGLIRLRKAAANGKLLPRFTLHSLCLLAEADVRGRICGDQQELLDKVQLCRELAKEGGCFDGPYPFPSDCTAYAYCSGKNVPAEYPLFDDTWGEVILLSGLPGTGKDTWIQENAAHLPMISLDEIRKELGVSPADNQSKVVELATQRAKEMLRKKQSFVWNATNITPQTRQRQINLFTAYGASANIVYLETNRTEQLRRNANRVDAVPEAAVCDMLHKLTPPERWEAQNVQWICV